MPALLPLLSADAPVTLGTAACRTFLDILDILWSLHHTFYRQQFSDAFLQI